MATDIWAKATGLLMAGYLSMSRSFAYLGTATLASWGVPVSGFPIYVGEVALAAFLLRRPRESLGRTLSAMIVPSPVSTVAWLVYLVLFYGIFELLRGIFVEGYPALVALEQVAFNYYPLYIFLGLWIGLSRPDFLRRFVRAFAWWNGIYGVVFVLFLGQLAYTYFIVPSVVPLFGQSFGAGVALLGLLYYERSFSRVWIPVLLNAFVLLGGQVRSEWLAFVVALVVWALVGRHVSRLLIATAALSTLLVVGYALDVRIPAPVLRGGAISTRDTVGRIVASVDEEAASRFSPDAAAYAATIDWRQDWWASIWETVNADSVRRAIGLGYGFPLPELSPHLLGSEDVRTPHNVFFYALGYGGWLGVAIFSGLLGAVARLLWRTYRSSGEYFGLIVFALGTTRAFFDSYFETPFQAIPFFLLAGLAAAPALTQVADRPVSPRRTASVVSRAERGQG